MLTHSLSRYCFQANSCRVIDSILDARSATLVALLDHCYAIVDHLAVGVRQRCTEFSNTEECDALTLGSFMKGIGRMGLWPRPHVSDILTSVAELSVKLKSLSLSTYQSIHEEYYGRGSACHKRCNTTNAFHSRVEQILGEKPKDVILDSFRRHLENQSK